MRVWIIKLVMVIMLTGCSSVPVKTVVADIPTSTPTIPVTPTITPSPAPTATPLPIIDQLIFEREIPQLSQEEMAKIVANAYRFKSETGKIYSLGIIPQTPGFFSVEAILIDLEKSVNQIDGDEFWRLLVITEVKRSGFEKADEKKYLVIPFYLDNDQDKKYTVNFMETPGGAPSSEGGSLVKVDTALSALNDQIEKHGKFQINILTQYYPRDMDIDEINTWSTSDYRYKRVMRIINNRETAETFVNFMIKYDYEGAVEFLESEKPFLLAIDISLSSN